ncbi:MAG: hypothetical protein ACP5OX_00670 [Minisyncoccia bacterium]
MKLIIPFLLLSIVFMPLLVSAQDTSQDTSTEPTIKFPTNLNLDLWGLLKKATKWLLNIVILVGVIIIVWAGFSYVTAGGDPEKTKKSLNFIIYALVGIIIALLAYWIVNTVLDFVGLGTKVKPPD